MNEALNLREALHRVDLAELDAAAEEIGRAAVAAYLPQRDLPMPKYDFQTPSQLTGSLVQPPDGRAEAEAERQRLLDAALADAIETVGRHRMRLGRRVCSRSDGTVTRQIYELLRSMAGADGGADQDPSFQ